MQGCTPLHACAHAESSDDGSAYTAYSQARAAFMDSAAADFAVMLLDHGANPATKNLQASMNSSTCADMQPLFLRHEPREVYSLTLLVHVETRVPQQSSRAHTVKCTHFACLDLHQAYA